MRYASQRTSRTIPILCALGLILYILVQIAFSYRGESSRLVGGDAIMKRSSLSLAPGELPGYTGWARPEQTLAGAFVLQSPLENPLIRDFDTKKGSTMLEFDFFCDEQRNPDCTNANSWFYVRGYGPAIVTGAVRKSETGPYYTAQVVFMDPGAYTVEVVLTISNAPEVGSYPTSGKDPASYYEGWLLPAFPVTVHLTGTSMITDHQTWCGLDDLVLSSAPASSYEPLSKARWKITDMARHASHAKSDQVTPANSIFLQAYRWSYNSIGFRSAYQYRDCHLLPAPPPEFNPLNSTDSCFAKEEQTIHVVLIGDSTMRLQRDVFKQQFAASSKSNIQIDFYELYGGTLLTQAKTGPDLKKAAATMSAETPRFILFNTGLHDIHRLCGHEFAQERTTYLQPDPEMACPERYRQAVIVLLEAVQAMPGTKVFQTTTAGWPKYGNFGVNWDPRYGQPLPLEGGFIEAFNQIAVEMVQAADIDVVDGYWIGAARPDNREIGEHAEIGNKLSHPGTEVVMAMVRIWNMILILTFCGHVPMVV